jgi:hypothetical protein
VLRGQAGDVLAFLDAHPTGVRPAASRRNWATPASASSTDWAHAGKVRKLAWGLSAPALPEAEGDE